MDNPTIESEFSFALRMHVASLSGSIHLVDINSKFPISGSTEYTLENGKKLQITTTLSIS